MEYFGLVVTILAALAMALTSIACSGASAINVNGRHDSVDGVLFTLAVVVGFFSVAVGVYAGMLMAAL